MSRPSDTLTTHSSTRQRRLQAVTDDRASDSRLASMQLSGSRCRSTTTRSRASGRCGSRRSSSTRELADAAGSTRSGSPTTSSSTSRSTAAPTDREACYDPIVTLAALARAVPDVRLGTLVLLRGAAARVGAGQGAGDARPRERRPARRRARRGLVRARVRRDRAWTMPRPGLRLDRLVDAIDVVKGLLGGGPFTYDGDAPPRRRRDEPCRPPCSNRGRACSSAARATGCCGSPPSTPTAGTRAGRGRPTRTANDCACSTTRATRSAAIRRPMWRTLGLYALCGEDERDLERRFERMARAVAAGRARRRRPRDVPRRPARRHRRTKCASRSRSGRRSASTRSSLGRRRGAVPGRRRPTTSSCCSGTRRGMSRAGRLATQAQACVVDGDQVAAPAQDAPPFAFGRAAPHAVLDAVERARTRGTRPAPGSRAQTCCADSTPRPSDGKNSVGADAAASGVEHPRVFLGGLVHDHLPFDRSRTAGWSRWFTVAPDFVRSSPRGFRIMPGSEADATCQTHGTPGRLRNISFRQFQ